MRAPFKISKKYSFGFLSSVFCLVVPVVISNLSLSDQSKMYSIIATEIAVSIITVAYITGQAKIDFTAIARASYGREDKNENTRAVPLPEPFRR